MNLLLIFSGLSFIVIKLNITPKKSIDFIKDLFKAKEIDLNEEILESENQENNFIENSDESITHLPAFFVVMALKYTAAASGVMTSVNLVLSSLLLTT